MRISGLGSFLATVLLLVGFGLVSCSGQQQDQEGLEQEEQGFEGNEDIDQQESGENFNQDNQGGGNNEFAQEGDNNLQLNQNDMQNFGGGENLLANDNLGEGAANSSENDLSNIISEMNQLSPEGNNQGANNMLQGNEGDSNAMAESETPAPVGGGSVMGMAGTPAGLGLPEMGSKLSYIVVRGDTMGKISSKIYGTSDRWQELAENSGFEDPSLIYPGDIVYYQLSEESIAFVSSYETLARQEVTVQKGDTLGTIAKEYYGDSKQWKYIWRQNGQILNPNHVEVGTKLFFITKGSIVAINSLDKSGSSEMKSSEKQLRVHANQWSPVG